MSKTHKSVICLLMFYALFTLIAMNADEASAVWYDANWGFRQKIIIDSSQVPGDLSNFPVLISKTDPNLRVSPAGNVGKANGGDILFTDSEGLIKYDHEIESYNSATGELVAWVRVPNLSSTAHTTIAMYYGNPGASDQENVDGVWDSNFLGVWHMNGDPSVETDCDGGAGDKEVCDSTINSFDGNSCSNSGCTAVMSSGDLVTGRIGESLNFNGSNRWIELGYVPLVLSTNITVEGWINFRSIAGRPSIFGRPWNWHFQIYNDGTLWFRRWNPYDHRWSTTVLSTDRWYHVAFTLATGPTDNLNIYIDGVPETVFPSGNMQTPVWSSWWFQMARVQGSGDIDWYDGFLDEMRLSNTVRSPEWIEASYNNQNNPSSFLAFGPQQIFSLAPTMTEWGMIIFMVLAGLAAAYSLKREKRA